MLPAWASRWITLLLTKLEKVVGPDLGRCDDAFGLGHAGWDVLVAVQMGLFNRL